MGLNLDDIPSNHLRAMAKMQEALALVEPEYRLKIFEESYARDEIRRQKQDELDAEHGS